MELGTGLHSNEDMCRPSVSSKPEGTGKKNNDSTNSGGKPPSHQNIVALNGHLLSHSTKNEGQGGKSQKKKGANKAAGTSTLIDVVNEGLCNDSSNSNNGHHDDNNGNGKVLLDASARNDGIATPNSASTITTAFSVEEFRELAEQMEAAAEMERRFLVSGTLEDAIKKENEVKLMRKGKSKPKRKSFDAEHYSEENVAKRRPGRPRKNSMSEEQKQFDQTVVSPSAKWPAIVVGDPVKELHRACQYGQTVSVETMLKKGTVSVSDTDSNHNTALHEAAVYDKSEVVKLLIKYGTPLEPLNVLNETPLQLSRSPLVTALLKEFIFRASASRPKLHSAVLSGDLEKVKAVSSEMSESVNEIDELGFTALHWCALKNRTDMIKCMNMNCSDLDLNCQSTDQKLTPLHEASRFNSSEAVQLLLDLGADPLVGDVNGFIPLDYCPNKLIRRIFRRFGRKKGIDELLQSPKLGESRDDDSNNPDSSLFTLDDTTDPSSSLTVHAPPSINVGFTREERKLQQVLSILERSGKSPARSFKDSKMLKKRGRPPKAAPVEAIDGAESPGGDAKIKDKATGKSLLYRYAAKGNVEMLRELIDAEPEIVKTADSAKRTALHEASLKGQVDAVKVLLTAGAFINAQASNGNTALHDASDHCHWLTVSELLNSGADRTITNNDGQRALDLTDDPEIRELLKSSPEDRSRVLASQIANHIKSLEEAPSSKRKPGRPRKHSNEQEIGESPKKSSQLILVNLDPISSSHKSPPVAMPWFFLSCQLETLSPSLCNRLREKYGRELNADDRDRLLSIPAISSALSSALHDGQRPIHLVEKEIVYRAARSGNRSLLDTTTIQYIDVSKSPVTVPDNPDDSNGADNTSLPFKFKMKSQWK